MKRGDQARRKDQGEGEEETTRHSETALYRFSIDQSGLRNLDELSLIRKVTVTYVCQNKSEDLAAAICA